MFARAPVLGLFLYNSMKAKDAGSYNEHGNDSILYRAVEPDSLIAVLRYLFALPIDFLLVS